MKPAIPTEVPSPIAAEYAAEVRHRLGHHAKRIVMFGSRARGDAREESDFDFIVIVDGAVRTCREQVLDAGVTLMDRRDALCAATVYDDAQWEKVRETPLGWNVEREGVAL
jgi:predicted nucleotidyltransferase